MHETELKMQRGASTANQQNDSVCGTEERTSTPMWERSAALVVRGVQRMRYARRSLRETRSMFEMGYECVERQLSKSGEKSRAVDSKAEEWVNCWIKRASRKVEI